MKPRGVTQSASRPPLRVLHAPAELAGQMGTLVEALREIGHEAEGWTYPRDRYRFGGVREIFPDRDPPLPQKLARMLSATRDAVNRFDLFHFHSGFTFLPRNVDLVGLVALGKPMVMHFWGSDVRLSRLARARNPWVGECLSERDDGAKVRRTRRLANWIPVALVADHELRGYVAEHFDRTEILPQALNLRRYFARPPNPAEKRPVVVHVPSNPRMKGTLYVVEAMKRLGDRFNFEFIQITGKPHSEALSVLERADIVVDQLLIGTHGILAVEGMALAKPVVCYIRDDLLDQYAERPPIVSATPKSIDAVLEGLLADGERRHALGILGRQYAERHHDSREVAKRLADVYASLR